MGCLYQICRFFGLSTFTNADFGSLQGGHLQVSGSFVKGVPGGMFWVGSPSSG